MDKCVPGASTVAVCEFSDNRVLEETNKIFKKEKNLKKGTIPDFAMPWGDSC